MQIRNQPDCNSCWCTGVHTEEGTLFRDNSDFSTGNEMTPSFFIMLSGQLIALHTQINWMGVGVSSKRIWIYRISHLSTRDHVTLYVRPPIIPARSHHRRGNKIGRWIGSLLDLSLVISAPTACVFHPSLSHAIPWGIGADCLLFRGARLDCFCVAIVFLVNGTQSKWPCSCLDMRSFLVGWCRLSMETQSSWNLYYFYYITISWTWEMF